jgi:hypothetical protein
LTCDGSVRYRFRKPEEGSIAMMQAMTPRELNQQYVQPTNDLAAHVEPFTNEKGEVTTAKIQEGMSSLEPGVPGEVKHSFTSPIVFAATGGACPYISKVHMNVMYRTGIHPPVHSGAYDEQGNYHHEKIQDLFKEFGVDPDIGQGFEREVKVMRGEDIDRARRSFHEKAKADIPWHKVDQLARLAFTNDFLTATEFPLLLQHFGVEVRVNGVAQKVITEQMVRNCLTNFEPMMERRVKALENGAPWTLSSI